MINGNEMLKVNEKEIDHKTVKILCISSFFIADIAAGWCTIEHFTVLWHVTRPQYENEIWSDLDMIDTKD